MLAQKDVLGLKELSDGGDPLTTPRTTSSMMEDPKVYGRDQEREKLPKVLLSSKEEAQGNNFGVVAIVGMGGLGKTTLAKNDPGVQQTFELRAWVCVSDQFDIARVTRTIIESVTCHPYSGSLNLNALQIELSDELRDKKSLLVLDDVWNENYADWRILQAPFRDCANSSKIIITASIVRADPPCV